MRYFDAPTVDDEQLALAATQLKKDFGHEWTSLVALNYVYQNQVYDYSATYPNQSSVGQILGHTLMPRWSARKELDAFWFEAEIKATRQ